MIVHVKLTNRAAYLEGLDAETYAALRSYWSFSPKGLWFMPRYKQTRAMLAQKEVTEKQIAELEGSPAGVRRLPALRAALADLESKLVTAWDGKISLLRNSQISAGLFRASWREAGDKCGVSFVADIERESLEFADGLPDSDGRYAFHNECVRRMIASVPKGGGLILAATASGKTKIASQFFSKITGNGLFVVDQLDLLFQQREEIEMWLGEHVGIVGDSQFDVARITVATIQTLHKHRKRPEFRKWFATLDAMVVDELHEQLANRNFTLLESIQPTAVFGMTATLQMKHKEVRYKAWAFAGPVLFEFPIKEGMDTGVLERGEVLQILFPEEEVGDEGELTSQVLVNDRKLLACRKITDYLLLNERYVLLLVDRLRHLDDVNNIMQHIPHRVACGAVDSKERKKAYAMFEKGEVRLLIANKVMKKGVNIKRLDAVIDMAEMNSKNDALQKLGRAARRHRDKDGFLYIDFGTQGKERFAKRAASRRNAFRKAEIDVTVEKVATTNEALAAVKRFMGEK